MLKAALLRSVPRIEEGLKESLLAQSRTVGGEGGDLMRRVS